MAFWDSCQTDKVFAVADPGFHGLFKETPYAEHCENLNLRASNSRKEEGNNY